MNKLEYRFPTRGHFPRYSINFIFTEFQQDWIDRRDFVGMQSVFRRITCTTGFEIRNRIKPPCTKTASGLNQAKCFIELWHPLFIMSLTAWAAPPQSRIPMNHIRERERENETGNINSCLSTAVKGNLSLINSLGWSLRENFAVLVYNTAVDNSRHIGFWTGSSGEVLRCNQWGYFVELRHYRLFRKL